MDAPIVTIKQGKLKGYIRTDIDGGQIVSFVGVPYAKPPVGQLRFKAPLPPEPWEGIKDVTEDGNNCYAKDLILKTVVGSEDCLNLNVFTKSLLDSNAALKPVMVFLHGGGFLSGSNKPDMYGPDFLLTQDVVLVVPNYRLGALGFLSSDDVTIGVPGNAGLKDQLLALQWVQENIRNFNGDPNNVTIFGESAGSASVHYLVLSPRAKGLFHKAVLQSGTALNSWAHGQQVMVALAKKMGHYVNSDREALDILREAPLKLLLEAQEELDKERIPSDKPFFAPVVEKPNDTAFITETPIDIIRSGNYNKVPLMIGYTSREGLLLATYDTFASMQGTVENKFPPCFEDIIPWQIGLERGSDISKQVCQKLEKTYFQGPDVIDNTHMLTSDSLFVAGILATVKNHLETSQNPIYLYRMSLEAELNVIKHFTKITAPGACHADDLGYLFKAILTPPIQPGSIEEISLRRFVKLWTNFAKYGNPTPDANELGIIWKPVKQGHLNFIDIGTDLTTGVEPEPKTIPLWKEIYQLNPDTANFL
nr:carboxylesterase [Anoplophora glabripennis]